MKKYFLSTLKFHKLMPLNNKAREEFRDKSVEIVDFSSKDEKKTSFAAPFFDEFRSACKLKLVHQTRVAPPFFEGGVSAVRRL